MLITCPTCASSYRIDAGKVPPEGRSVRCAACRETWFLTPGDAEAEEGPSPSGPEDEDVYDPVVEAAWAQAAAAAREKAAPEPGPAEPEPRSPRRPAKQAKAKPKGKAKRGGLASSRLPISFGAVSLLTLLAALPVACLARNGVVGLMPQTASVFAAIGLPVNRRGLDIRDVVAFQNPPQDDRPGELIVEGDLVGVGRGDARVPILTVEISDAAGRALTSFRAPTPRAVLGAGETARFRARLAEPPAEGRTILLRFADAAPAPEIGDRFRR